MIKLRHLERRYPLGKEKFFYVLRDINLDIAEGEFVSVMGPSGAGKSTLLHILGMHDHGWEGEYSLGEAAVHHLKPKERSTLRNEQIGFVFQQYHLLDDLTVYENLEIPLSYRHYSKSERAALVADTLDRFQIVGKKDLYPRQLSGGQQQLVGVARAIIAEPKLLLADEPTGNLHSSQGEEIMELFRKLNGDGMTIVQVTHSEKNASYGSRVIQLRDGWIVNQQQNTSAMILDSLTSGLSRPTAALRNILFKVNALDPGIYFAVAGLLTIVGAVSCFVPARRATRVDPVTALRFEQLAKGNEMLDDFRYAVRQLIKNPSFTLIAVFALALGIGANTAIFSVVNAVLLRPLPYPEPDKLILLRETSPIFTNGSVGYMNWLDWQAGQRSFTDIALVRRESVNFSFGAGLGSPERLRGVRASSGFLSVLGLKPKLGRDLGAADDVAGAPNVALISENLWRHDFGASPSILGRRVLIDGLQREVIGVFSDELQFGRKPEVLLPLSEIAKEPWMLKRDYHQGWSGLGRLKPGVTMSQAASDLNAIAIDLEKKYPQSNAGRRVRLQVAF